jgi:5-methylcytosine-specific restriction endonuclease McrA
MTTTHRAKKVPPHLFSGVTRDLYQSDYRVFSPFHTNAGGAFICRSDYPQFSNAEILEGLRRSMELSQRIKDGDGKFLSLQVGVLHGFWTPTVPAWSKEPDTEQDYVTLWAKPATGRRPVYFTQYVSVERHEHEIAELKKQYEREIESLLRTVKQQTAPAKAKVNRVSRSRENRQAMRHNAMILLGERDGQGWACFYCHAPLLPYGVNGQKRSPVTDHKTPFADGGTHDVDNLVLCCRDCNNRKGMMTAEQFAPIAEKLRAKQKHHEAE